MDKPIWSPSQERIERANLNRFMRFVREETGNADLNSYAPLWQFSVDQPERFWTLLWDFCGIRATGSREPALLDADGGPQWFPNIRLNVAQNLLRFDDDRTALLARTDDGWSRRVSHAELRARVATVAAALREAAIGPGDAVLCTLEVGIEWVISWLATAAVGATWLEPGDEPASEPVGAAGAAAPAWLFAHAEHAEHWFATMPSLRAGLLVGAVGGGPTPAHSWPDFESEPTPAFEFTPFPFDQPLLAQSNGDRLQLHGAGGVLMQHLKELVLHLDIKREDKLLFADPERAGRLWIGSALALGATLLLPDRPLDDVELWDTVDECAVSVVIADSARMERIAAADQAARDTHKLLGLKSLIACGEPLGAAAISGCYARIKDRLFLTSAVPAAGMLGCALLGAPLLPVHADGRLPRALAVPVDDQPLQTDDVPPAATTPARPLRAGATLPTSTSRTTGLAAA